MRTETAFDGFAWEIELDETTLVVRVRRTAFSNTCAQCAHGSCEECGKRALHDVAIGEWNGEAIELRRLPNPRGEAFHARRYLPILSSILHTASQGRCIGREDLEALRGARNLGKNDG